MTWGLILIVVIGGGAVVFLGFLFFRGYGDSQRRTGALEERNAEDARQAAAVRRADEVLAEQRDPDDVAERLRRGEF